MPYGPCAVDYHHSNSNHLLRVDVVLRFNGVQVFDAPTAQIVANVN